MTLQFRWPGYLSVLRRVTAVYSQQADHFLFVPLSDYKLCNLHAGGVWANTVSDARGGPVLHMFCTCLWWRVKSSHASCVLLYFHRSRSCTWTPSCIIIGWSTWSKWWATTQNTWRAFSRLSSTCCAATGLCRMTTGTILPSWSVYL